MAGFEIERILELMDKPKDVTVDTFEELKEIIDTTFKLVKTDFMKFHHSFPEKNVLRGSFSECFAYEGISGIGLIDEYECGIVIRGQGWLEELGVDYDMTPEFTGA